MEKLIASLFALLSMKICDSVLVWDAAITASALISPAAAIISIVYTCAVASHFLHNLTLPVYSTSLLQKDAIGLVIYMTGRKQSDEEGLTDISVT